MNKNFNPLIFNIQEYSVQDGIGIRTTIFFKGCPLKCFWCCNPEGQHSYSELMYLKTLCKKCYSCLNICEFKAIKENETGYLDIDRKLCKICNEKICVEVCPNRALKISGESHSAESLIERILPSIAFYKNSGGGITLSGGEPLMHPEFINNFLEYCEKNIISCGVETCGYFDLASVKSFINKFEFIYFDIKTTNEEMHKEYTGADFITIKNNLIYLSKNYINNLIISVPVIPGFNDNEIEIKNIAGLCKKLNIKKIRLLPYHNFGNSKYSELGLPVNIVCETLPPTNIMYKFYNILNEAGLVVQEI